MVSLEEPSAIERELVVESDGLRVDVFLSEHFPDESRSSLKRWIKDGRVSSERSLKPATRLNVGERLVIRLPEPEPEPGPLEPEDIPIELLGQDAAVLVVNKPPGLTVHPGAGQSSGTLVNALLALGGPLSSAGGEERPGIVHRLDKETSGVMVVARSDLAHRRLSAQFKERRTAKRYAAVVKGSPPDRGTIDKPIGRNIKDRKRMAIRWDGGRHAVSHYEVVERFGDRAARLDVRIETGRTHQIRVHLASIGHGIVGDKVYGRGDPLDREIDRHALHAAELCFDHPLSGERCCHEAPLPEDMRELIAWLRGEAEDRSDGGRS